ncbi:MAG: alpha/beta fold hydrolase [Lachnospiraceae bacterium]|jgi:pimeloyl-ACP methyl ester carboxylesterase|nr:alpha/beta fold hydrolase [Lachnospiraceae bacterium]
MKTKNKLLTLLILSSGAISTTSFINKLIQLKATKNNLLETQPSCYFKWRLGDIHYTKTGSGKPILLIHDLNASSSIYEWSRLIPLLAKNYTIYAVDLLGCGSSEKVNTTYTNYLYVQLITDFIKSEIGHRTNVIATSEAASIPIMACSNNPDIFDQIMLINPLSLSDYCQIPGKSAKLYKKIVDLPALGTLLYHIAVSKKFIYEELEKYGFYDSYYVNCSLVDAYYEAAHLGLSPKSVYISQKCNYTKCNIVNALKKINNSIYLIGGQKIQNVCDRLEEYKIYNPAIEISFIPKTKNLPQLEKPDYLSELISTYFS